MYFGINNIEYLYNGAVNILYSQLFIKFSTFFKNNTKMMKLIQCLDNVLTLTGDRTFITWTFPNQKATIYLTI